jgi:hypothetical protein
MQPSDERFFPPSAKAGWNIVESFAIPAVMC